MAKILEAHKRGEWYTVKGVHEGQVVSADVHASEVDGRSPEAGRQRLEKAITQVAIYEAMNG